MNFADYLSELLGQHDEVSVPGLGCFVRERINGYYNDKESKFYPPYHQVKFVPKAKDDDDTFAQYVADKKNISLASSKYFAEKFISKLREDAARSKFLFADLGSFQLQQDQLVFKPNEKVAADPSFYGYPPINIYKVGQSSSDGVANLVFVAPTQSPVIAAQPIQTDEQQQYFEEETEGRRGLNIWLILLICIAAVAFALFGVYKFYPATFDKLTGTYHKLTSNDTAVVPVVRHETKTDTAKKATLVNDTTAKTPPPVTTAIDTGKLLHFEIIAIHFRKWQKAKAEAEVDRFKTIGLDAKIARDAPGPFIKISVGTYFTQKEADSARLVLVNSGKISKYSDEPLEIKPKQ